MRAQYARAVGAQARGLADQAELDGVPVQAREHLAGAQPRRLQAALAVALHVVGQHRVEEQRHVAEQVVEHVGLDDVLELLGPAYPVRHGELAGRQQAEERHLGNQPRHGHELPARGAVQALVDVVEARDALLGAQQRQGGDEGLARQARQLGRLAQVQAVVGVVVLRGVGGPVLRAGVVVPRARVVAARRSLARAIDGGLHGHVILPWPGCR